MADSVWVWTCEGTRGQRSVALTADVHPTCSPASAASWVEVSASADFLGRPVDEESFGQLLEAVVLLFATAYCVRYLVRNFSGRR